MRFVFLLSVITLGGILNYVHAQRQFGVQPQMRGAGSGGEQSFNQTQNGEQQPSVTGSSPTPDAGHRGSEIPGGVQSTTSAANQEGQSSSAGGQSETDEELGRDKNVGQEVGQEVGPEAAGRSAGGVGGPEVSTDGGSTRGEGQSGARGSGRSGRGAF